MQTPRAQMRSDEVEWRDDVMFRDYQRERAAISNALAAMRGRKHAKLRRERYGIVLWVVGLIGAVACALTWRYEWLPLPICALSLGTILINKE